jgi:hypothetical protein
MLSHLLLGGQTVTELIEYEIGIDGRDATYEDHKHPFHGFRLRSRLLIGNDDAPAKFRPRRQPISLARHAGVRSSDPNSAGFACTIDYPLSPDGKKAPARGDSWGALELGPRGVALGEGHRENLAIAGMFLVN